MRAGILLPRPIYPLLDRRSVRINYMWYGATMLVDSHCHLDFPDFATELDAIVARAEAAGVGHMVTISPRVKCHAQILAIAKRFPNVTCSVGTHPHHAHEELDITAEDVIARAQHPKVVAIGEAGLDYHYDNSPRD